MNGNTNKTISGGASSIKSLKNSAVCNEKGIALVMILILAAIALLIMAALLYMITSSTQISGMQKRYKTALEASFGGADIAYQFIARQGDPGDTSALQTLLSSLNPVMSTPSSCTGYVTEVDGSHTTYTGLRAKLLTPTSSWTNCDSTMSIDPSFCTGSACSYDMTFRVPGTPTDYLVYAKLVDTIEGNSSADTGLGGEGVVTAGTGVVTVMKMPYLYTIEMDAQAVNNPSERGKLSILYQY